MSARPACTLRASLGVVGALLLLVPDIRALQGGVPDRAAVDKVLSARDGSVRSLLLPYRSSEQVTPDETGSIEAQKLEGWWASCRDSFGFERNWQSPDCTVLQKATWDGVRANVLLVRTPLDGSRPDGRAEATLTVTAFPTQPAFNETEFPAEGSLSWRHETWSKVLARLATVEVEAREERAGRSTLRILVDMASVRDGPKPPDGVHFPVRLWFDDADTFLMVEVRSYQPTEFVERQVTSSGWKLDDAEWDKLEFAGRSWTSTVTWSVDEVARLPEGLSIATKSSIRALMSPGWVGHLSVDVSGVRLNDDAVASALEIVPPPGTEVDDAVEGRHYRLGSRAGKDESPEK